MIKKILVSQPAPSSEKSPYFDIAKKYNVQIDFRPLIHVERLSAKEFRAEKVSILDHTAIVFNSHHAIDHFFSMCKDLRLTMPDEMKYFFISEKVALYVQKYIQYRKRKVFFGKTGQWDDLINVMAKYKKEKFLIPQSDVHQNDLDSRLDAKGLNHTDVSYGEHHTGQETSVRLRHGDFLYSQWCQISDRKLSRLPARRYEVRLFRRGCGQSHPGQGLSSGLESAIARSPVHDRRIGAVP